MRAGRRSIRIEPRRVCRKPNSRAVQVVLDHKAAVKLRAAYDEAKRVGMMAKKLSALAGIFNDEPEAPVVAAPEPRSRPDARQLVGRGRRSRQTVEAAAPAKRSSHPGKKPVLIRIPGNMHRTLRQYLVNGCHMKFVW